MKARTWPTLYDALHCLLSESGMTYRELSRATGVSEASLVFFLTGQRTLRLDTADRLAQYFGLVISEPRGSRRRKRR